MKKSLTRILGIGALIIGLSGCQGTIQRGTFEDYPFQYGEGINYPTLLIYSRDKNGGYISFEDVNNDGRFDNVVLLGVKKGDPVEAYANLEAAQKIMSSLSPAEEEKQ